MTLNPSAIGALYDALVTCRNLIDTGCSEQLTQREIEATLKQADEAIQLAAGGPADAEGEVL